MSCPYSPEDLSAYIDGETGPSARRQIRDHLRVCSKCRQTVEGLSRVSEALRGLPSAEPRRPAAWRADQFSGPKAQPIHCAVVLPEGSAFIDGELTGDDVPSVLAHLAECDACYGAYREIEGIADALAFTPPVAVPDDLEGRILVAVEADRHKVMGHLLRRVTEATGPAARVAVRLAAAAAVVALVVFGVYRGTVRVPVAGDVGSAVAVVPNVETAETAEIAIEPLPVVPVPERGLVLRPPVTSEPHVPPTAPPGATGQPPPDPHVPSVPDPDPASGPESYPPETVPDVPTVVSSPGPPPDVFPVLVPSVPEGVVPRPVVASTRGPRTDGAAGPAGAPAEAPAPEGSPKSAPPDAALLVSVPEADTEGIRLADSGAAAPLAPPEPQINWSSPRANPEAATLPAASLDLESLRALERDTNAGLRAEGRGRAPSFTIHP